MKTNQTKAAASTKQIKAKASASASIEETLGHDKAATESGSGQKQPEILLSLNPVDFPPLDFSNLVLYRPGEGLDDYVILPGEEGDEVIYYGKE